MALVKANGIKLHVQQLNPKADQPIIMLHGLVGNLAQWYFSMAPVLAEKYRVIMIDLKSHGKSQKVTTGYDLKSMAEDVVGLMDALNLEKASLVGYSYGAQIALKFAIDHPDRLEKLILVESPSPEHKAVDEIIKEYDGKSTKEIAQLLPNNVMGKIENEVGSRMAQPIVKRMIKSFMKLFDYLCTKTTLIEDLNKEKDFSTEDLADIQNETLLLYGKGSDCLKEAEKLSRWIKPSQLIMKDGGHWFPIERPVEVGKDIMTFLMEEKEAFYSMK